jgi:peptidoglycan/LPS O-acetylase OafA/YrhL
MGDGLGERRVRYLDGLRGVACLQVVLLHVLSAYFPDFIQDAPGSFGNAVRNSPLFVLYNGWLAVFVFFILSGYVLTAAYGGAGETARRIEARVVRLWIPATSFGAVAVLMYFAFYPAKGQLAELNGSEFLKACWNASTDLSGMLRDVFVFPIFTGYRNGLVPKMIPAAASAFVDTERAFNAPVWTLNIEMIGSLLVMWLAFCRRRHGAGWVVSIVVGSLASPTLACFVAGHLAAVASLADRGVLPRRFAAVMNFVLFAAGVYLSGDAGNAARLFLGALLIFVAVVQSRLVRGILASDVCMAIGRRSVTIYLLHWPFVLGFGAWVLVWLDPVLPWQTARLFVAPAVILVVLALSGPLSTIDAAAVSFARRVARGETEGFIRGAISALMRRRKELRRHPIAPGHGEIADTRSDSVISP